MNHANVPRVDRSVDEPDIHGLTARLDGRITKSLEFMTANLDRPLVLSDIAGQVCLSTSRFCHLFRQQTGTSPKQALGRMRMDRANELLLDTDLPIKAVAIEVGFQHTSTFIRSFRSARGTTPGKHKDAVVRG